MTEISHEWDPDGECSIGVSQKTPRNWKWEWADVAGIALTTVGGLFSVVAQGFGLLSQECMAHAEWRRLRFDEAEQRWQDEADRAEMAGTLEGMVYFDGEAPS